MLVCFQPVIDHNTKIIIVGSMPGKDSLAKNQYYAHKRNAFWLIMAELFGENANFSYTERLNQLLINKVGLWDAIHTCQRKTSLDSDIVEHSITANNFKALLQNHPSVTTLCFNGLKSEQVFKRYVVPTLSTDHLQLVRLPSTSPANATMTFEQKLSAWREVLLPEG